MQYWASDYQEGCAPEILKRMEETNLDHHVGYGKDSICIEAKEKIRKACGRKELDVNFLVGGSQTNSTVVAAVLKQWQGVLSADSGHINCHEAGAVEYTGHKVLALPSYEGGKISASSIAAYVEDYRANESYDHIVEPGMVYISHPTEYGTLYSKAELAALHEVCAKYQLPLFLDGARLGYGLEAVGTDVTLKDIASLTDVFYIGGTKVGVLFGEAVVSRPGLLDHFFNQTKQHGALLAKGWLLGIQFDALFTDHLYERLGKNAITMASLLKEGLKKKGYVFHPETITNQLFVVLENGKMKELAKDVVFSEWEPLDKEHTVVRFATSWSTRKEDVSALLELL